MQEVNGKKAFCLNKKRVYQNSTIYNTEKKKKMLQVDQNVPGRKTLRRSMFVTSHGNSSYLLSGKLQVKVEGGKGREHLQRFMSFNTLLPLPPCTYVYTPRSSLHIERGTFTYIQGTFHIASSESVCLYTNHFDRRCIQHKL